MKKLFIFAVLATFTFAATAQNTAVFKTGGSKKLECIGNNAKSITDSVHYDGPNNDGIGTGAAASFGIYMYMPTDTMANYVGKQIQKVKVYINGVGDVSSTQIEIHEDQTSGAIYTQSFTPVEGWNTVLLTTPFSIDGTQDIYLGCFIDATGGYPAGCDAGPTAAGGNGDWMLFNGAWDHLPNLGTGLNYNWNIRAMIGQSVDNDAALSNISVPSYVVEGDVDITGTILNAGVNTLNSIEVNWQVDGGTTYTETLTGLNLATNQTYDFTHQDVWTATEGEYVLDVWLSNFNGNGQDDIPDNDQLTKNITVALQSVQKKALYEEFTSSTCPPCATFNNDYFNETFLTANEGSYSLIKYQMNWPGAGDPYYTPEGGARKDYYGVSAVPALYCDATEGTHFSTTDLQTALDNAIAKPAFFEIDANHQIDATWETCEVQLSITPYISGQYTVHTVVIENLTTENATTNGETEFINVMMKMIPDAGGSTVDFIAGTPSTLDLSGDLSGTNIEEFTDLSVVVFIQKNSTKQVMQSEYSVEGIPAPSASFIPGDGTTGVSIDSEISIQFNTAMRMVDDSEITDSDIAGFVSLTDPSKSDIDFTATINDTKTAITVIPTESLPYETDITITVSGDAIENSDDVALGESSATFTTEEDDTDIEEINKEEVSIFPNPVKEMLKIKQNGYANVKIYNLMGSLVFEQEINNNTSINISALEAGNYIVTISSNDKEYKKLISIMK